MSSMTRRKFLFYSAAIGASTIAGCRNPCFWTQLKENALAPSDEFIDYDTLGLAQLTKKKDISQLELVEVIIRRIEKANPVFNFMTTPAFDRARKKAGTIPLDTPFAGVPILMKDMIDVGGIRRTDGSKLTVTIFRRKTSPMSMLSSWPGLRVRYR
jgi:amidase